MIELIDVYTVDLAAAKEWLFSLLKERTQEQSISHKAMPTWEDHCAFVDSAPYEAWYLVEADNKIVGATYLTANREIGLFIFKAEQHKGYGKKALAMMRERHPGHLLANVNPNNIPSRIFWEELGGEFIQVTYRLE